MLPINIDIHFYCRDNNETSDWDEVIDTLDKSLRSSSFGLMDSLSFSISETTVKFYATVKGNSSYWFGMAGTIDTSQRKLSLIIQENRNNVSTLQYSGPYSQADSHIVVYTDRVSAGTEGLQHFSCGEVFTHGFFSTGGALPPANVLRKKSLSSHISNIRSFDGGIQISVEETATTIRIFDILGRECDRIAIPDGAESVDYNTLRLVRGIYFAQLGRDVVKFVVQ
jgi:hypothetical protein